MGIPTKGFGGAPAAAPMARRRLDPVPSSCQHTQHPWHLWSRWGFAGPCAGQGWRGYPADVAVPCPMSRVTGGRVLQLQAVQEEHRGSYTCEATNAAGRDRLHYELEVLSEYRDRGHWTDAHGSPVTACFQLPPPSVVAQRSCWRR